MRAQIATDAGSATKPSEDRALVGSNLLVVIDGATARTDTGCRHGVPWFADHLGTAIFNNGALGPSGALAVAIASTADLHRDTCDLSHPGTPSAAVAVVQIGDGQLRYLVLGDVTVVVDAGGGPCVVSDERVSQTARRERDEADALPNGSPQKAAALVRMKHAELAARNTSGGYWIAAADPAAVDHAITGVLPLSDVRRMAILTDGAARAVDTFGQCDWPGLLETLATSGPTALIAGVREAEASDPEGVRWPRNKISDDATAVYCDGFR